ncbi:hypothetical protein [Actinospongicola halichondriae]|uniref:hypothetical protein n=1 Tax=Actinospongicola halichondriae TaxID=3236844 RepID=UPI003D410688
MRRRWVLVLGSLLLAAACTPSATSSDDGTVDPTAATPSTAAGGDPALGDLTHVVGTVTTGDLVGALDGTAALPIVLTVAERGGGNGAIITGVDAADGDTVVWDGGRPITLDGDGTIAVQPGGFRVGDGGFFADLSGAAHPLSPGRYTVAGPVAVGAGGGLAAPSTQTGFSATEGAVLSGTGRVEGRLPPGTWLLLGPGRVSLTGDLRVQTSEGSDAATTVTMEQGSFEVTFTVADDGTVTVDALLDGDVGGG